MVLHWTSATCRCSTDRIVFHEKGRFSPKRPFFLGRYRMLTGAIVLQGRHRDIFSKLELDGLLFE